MKKIFAFLCMLSVMLSFASALAGSVPEDLLHSDDAQIFFGEVVSFVPDGPIPYVEVIPTMKIKGDVIVDGSCGTWQRANAMGNIQVKPGKIYLFTYYDENNPTDIFEVTSYNTSTLRLKNVSGDMWERFEKYLHEGRYEEAERERLDRIHADSVSEEETLSLIEFLGVPKEEIKTVMFSLASFTYDIAPDVFCEIAENIMVEDTTEIYMEDAPVKHIPEGLYITVNGAEGFGFAFITKDGKADRYSMMMSRLPMLTHRIEPEKAELLFSLIAEDTTTDGTQLPIKNAPYILYAMAGVCFIAAFVLGFAAKKKKRRE